MFDYQWCSTGSWLSSPFQHDSATRQAFQMATTQLACSDRASWYHVGSLHLCIRCGLQRDFPIQLLCQWKDNDSSERLRFTNPALSTIAKDTGQRGLHKHQYNTTSLLLTINNWQVTWRTVKQVFNVQRSDSAGQAGQNRTAVALCRKASVIEQLLIKTFYHQKYLFLFFLTEIMHSPTFTNGPFKMFFHLIVQFNVLILV